MLFSPHVDRLIDLALTEDLIAGDVTTDAIFDEGRRGAGYLLAKSDLVLAGASIFDVVMHRLAPTIAVTWDTRDGQRVDKGTVFAALSGPVAGILKAERTALNFLQRLSGIATLTRHFVDATEGHTAVIADTRKTLPAWRELDKYAVRCGGGRNHRFNLGAGAMIKDNHIAAAGGIRPAVERVRARAPHTIKIEVEVTSQEELAEALEAGADVILLDNMSADEIRTAVTTTRAHRANRAGHVILEASGNVTIERTTKLAATGVDVISVGAITHSVPSADISLKLEAPTLSAQIPAVGSSKSK